MKNHYKIVMACFIAVLILSSCGGGGGGSDNAGSASDTTMVSIRIGGAATLAALSQATAIPPDIDRITVQISAPDMATITGEISGGTTATFSVPNGYNRHFIIQAAGSSDLLYQGDAYADLTGTPVTLNISMKYVGPAPGFAITYGGSNTDRAHCICPTADGGCIVAGETNSFGAGGSDIWVLKLNSDGSIARQKTFGGSGNDHAYSVQQTGDGGCIVAGETNSFGAGGSDTWVLKLNSDGGVDWQNTYGGSGDDYAYSVQETEDGGYIVGGVTHSFGAGDSEVWVLKLNSAGGVVWQNMYGGSGDDHACSIRQTADGGYIVAGETNSFGAGGSDIWILKLDSEGAVVWQNSYGGNGDDYVARAEQTGDGGYIVGGFTWGFGAGLSDAWILKLNSDGSIIWQKTYGGGSYDWADSLDRTVDGGCIVAGCTYSSGSGDPDIWVLKLDSSGSIVWQKAFGGSGYDYARSVRQDLYGRYLVAGYTASFGAGLDDFWILKLKSDGTCSSLGTDTGISARDTSVTPSSTSISALAATSVVISGTSITGQDTVGVINQQAP